MVHSGGFTKTAVVGWALDRDEVAQLFLLQVVKRTNVTEDTHDTAVEEFCMEYLNWKAEHFHGGDHDQPVYLGVKTSFRLSDETMLEWCTLQDVQDFLQRVTKYVDRYSLKDKARENNLVQTFPDYFQGDASIYLVNNDCLCCT